MKLYWTTENWTIEQFMLKIEHFNCRIDHTCINHINLDIIFFVFTINHHHLSFIKRQICKQQIINYISLYNIILHTIFVILPLISSTYLRDVCNVIFMSNSFIKSSITYILKLKCWFSLIERKNFRDFQKNWRENPVLICFLIRVSVLAVWKWVSLIAVFKFGSFYICSFFKKFIIEDELECFGPSQFETVSAKTSWFSFQFF